jgi:hypothetical protein
MLQTLLIIGMLMNLLNHKWMEDSIRKSILEMYFPVFKNFRFKKDIKGREIDVLDRKDGFEIQ